MVEKSLSSTGGPKSPRVLTPPWFSIKTPRSGSSRWREDSPYRGGVLACNAMSMPFRRGSFPVINCECSSPPGMRRTSFYYRNMLRSGMQACVIVFAISPLFFRPSCHRKITTWTEHITFPENNGDAHAQARQHPVPLLKHL